ncbi:MAG: ATP-grasp domain-containing protein [Anaerolineales bacterium]|nr:ATP-grasp domain-containing protein [Anaerolineales bacterium]
MNAPGIVVLYNVTDEVCKGEPQDLIAERGVISCAETITQALATAGYRVMPLPVRSEVEACLSPYPPSETVVFNLAEGLGGRLFEEARIAFALEAMGYSFTGSDGVTLALAANKLYTKALLADADIPTPTAFLLDGADGLPDEHLPGALIVKPVAEDASQGIDEDAVVTTVQALRERVAYVVERYEQAALAEEFIAGREFNVAVWGNAPAVVLPLAEVDFSAFHDSLECIVSYAAKWLEDSFSYSHTPVRCPADVSPEIGQRLVDVAHRAYQALGCSDYARVDIRLDSAGTPYVIDVNPNPDLSPDAGFFRACRTAGYTYTQMVERILSFALQRGGEDDLNSYRTRWRAANRPGC